MSACTNCSSTDTITVRFEAGGGTDYTYCRYCEHRHWVSDEKKVDLKQVLATASTIEPARARR